jgi:hypothetical protein
MCARPRGSCWRGCTKCSLINPLPAMIGEILISDKKSFGPMCTYVGGGAKEAEVLAAHGVRDTSFAHMAEDFDAQRALNPRLGRAVMHVALAWPPEEKAMSNELMLELTRAWMKEMKIDAENTQWSLTRHNNTKHPHGHLIINRVANDGSTISDKKDYDKSVDACRKLEKQYGLVNAKEAGQDTRRAKREELPKREAAKLYVQDSESRHKPPAASVEELFAAMKRDGINAQATYQKGKLQAVVFEYQGHYFKGSELGRECSGNNLAKTIDAQRDSVLAQRAAVGAATQRVGQINAGLKAFLQPYGARKQANEKAAQQAQVQKQADEKAEREAKERQLEPAEKATKQVTPSVEKVEKPENPDLDYRLRPGYKKPPTIQKDNGLEM